MRGGSQRQSFSIRMAAPTVQRDIGGSSASAERGYVKLNVGGTLHVTTRATLTAHGGESDGCNRVGGAETATGEGARPLGCKQLQLAVAGARRQSCTMRVMALQRREAAIVRC